MASKIPLLILVTALLILGLIVFFGVLGRVHQFAASLPQVIEHEMQTSLGRQVSIGSVSMTSLRTAVITDLTINDRSEFGQGAFFAAPRAVVTFDTIRILRGGPVAPGITSVVLFDSRITVVRNAGNAWNVEDLVRRPPSPPPTRFRGRVVLRSARVTVIDHLARVGRRPESNTATNVSGTVDFSPAHSFLVDVSGDGNPARVRHFRVTGRWKVDQPVTRLNVTVQGANARYWMDYFSDISIWTFSRGTFDSQAVLYQPTGQMIVARGSVTLNDSLVTSPYLRLPIVPFTGDAAFVGTNIRIAGRGLLGKSPVTIAGQVTGLAHPTLDLRASSNRMDFNTLQSAIKALPSAPYIRWTAPGTAYASITGPASNPLVTGTVAVPGVIVRGTPARAIAAAGYYKARVIHVTSVTGQAAQGRFSASGAIDIKPLRISLSATATGLRVASTAIDSANGRLVISNGQITVQRLTANAARGQMTAQGRVTFAGALDLGLAAKGVDLLTLLRRFGYTQFTGTAAFDGRLTGTMRSPVLTGQVTARNGELRGIRYDLATGRLIATDNSLTLKDAVIRQGPTEIATTGTIVVQRQTPPAVALQVHTTGVDLSQIVSLLNLPVRAKGLSSANLSVQGAYPNLQISGEINVEGGSVAGIAFDSARLQVETVGGRTVLRQFTAVRGASRLVGSGFIGPGSAIEVNLTGENLDLNLLNDAAYPYAVLQGPVTLSAQVRGTVSRPTLTGTFESVNPLVDHQQFESLTASVAWDGKSLSVSNGKLAGQGTTWSLPLIEFTPGTSALEFQGTVASGSVAETLAIIRNSPVVSLPQGKKIKEILDASPTLFTGAFDGAIRLSGPLAGLNGDASITATAVQMGSQKVDKVELQLAELQSVLTLQRLAVTSPGVNLSASAEFVKAKPSTVAATIQDTRLADLLALIRSATFLSALNFGNQILNTAQSFKAPIAGTMNATISLADIQTALTGTISLAGTGVTISNQPIGDLTASARIANGSVMVDQFNAAGPSGQVALTGTVNSEGQISLSGSGTHISLVALRPFVHDNTLAGTADLGLAASGTMDNPTVQISLSAANTVIGGLALDSIAADKITIANDRIASDRITVKRNGGSAILSGSLPFSLTPPIIPADQPITLHADISDDSLSFAKSFTSLIENASGVFTAAINVTGTISKPVINGPISLVDGFMKLKGFANSVSGVTASARFVNSVLTLDSLQGKSSLGGTFGGNGSVTMTSLTNGLVSLYLSADALRLSLVDLGGPGGSAIFNATGQLVVGDTVRSPVVQGNVVVSDARIVIPPNLVPTSVELPALPISPQLAVTMNLANDVAVQRGGLRAQIVGPVTIAGTASSPIVSGTVQIASGRLAYPARTLNLKPGGTASFLLQPPQPAVISIDVQATTTLTGASGLTGTITRYAVTLDITGPIGDLSIDVRTSPPGLSELEALAAIFGGSALEALLSGAPLGSVFQDQFGQLLLGLALPGLFQPVQIGGVMFSLEPGLEVPLQISASTQLTNNVTLFISQSIAGRIPLQTYGFTYSLSPQFAATLQFEGLNGAPQESTMLLQYYKRR